MTDEIIKSIENNDYIMFNKHIKSIHSELELSIIDSYLLKNKSFDFNYKLEYGNKKNRKLFLMDLFQDVAFEFLSYDYFAITYVAINSMHGKDRNKYLLEAFLKTNDKTISSFLLILKKNDCYDIFIKFIKKCELEEVKLKALLYLDLNVFDSIADIIKYIKNANLSTKEKINYLVLLAKRKDVNDDYCNSIKEEISLIYGEYQKRLINDLDDELVEVANKKYCDELSSFYNEIDKARGGVVYLHK